MPLPEVRIRHLRYANLNGRRSAALHPFETIQRDGWPVEPRGGVTEATLFDPETEEVLAAGKAVCSDRENFCRSRGREIAIGRAIKEWCKILNPPLKVVWDPGWYPGGSISILQLADVVINSSGVVIKDRYGPVGRNATAEEIAMADEEACL